MVLRVADICSKVVENSNLFIATDSKKIKNCGKIKLSSNNDLKKLFRTDRVRA